jgi:hypothetical protein
MRSWGFSVSKPEFTRADVLVSSPFLALILSLTGKVPRKPRALAQG